MRIRKKNLWAVLLLALVLAFAGCQTSAARESVENVRTEEGSTDSTATADNKTDSGEETADSETDSGEESGEEAADSAAASTEEPQYIDEEYVDEHYGETEEEDLSKYSEDTSSSAEQSGVSSEDTAGNDGGQENGDATSVPEEASAENYYTDPVPEGMPQPVEPQDEVVNTDQTLTCTLMVECSTILNNMENLTEGKESLVPSDGVIFGPATVTFYNGESVYDVLQREMQNNRIHMESEFTAMYNSAYVEGINNLYEFDCGRWSGWMYCVNGWYPNYGCSRYQVQEGDVIEWHYTCDLGRDLGRDAQDWQR